jgi:hemolysin III
MNMADLPQPAYTAAEEIANSTTHGVGFLLGIAALALMAVFTALRGTVWHVVSCSVYGATLVLLYLSSTLYHSIPAPRAKRVFKVLDHASIYLLIAGTYTPFALVTLRQSWGWPLFGIIWGLAAAGIILKAFYAHRFRRTSTAVYIAMGWLIVAAIRSLYQNLPREAVWLLVMGGVFYTGGTVFYLRKNIRFFHSVWHLFVLAGSACHFFSVFLYVIP